MKILTVTARFVKAKDLKVVIPNAEGDMSSPAYRALSKRILELKETQPTLYNKIMYWD